MHRRTLVGWLVGAVAGCENANVTTGTIVRRIVNVPPRLPPSGGGAAPTLELDASDSLRFQWTDSGAVLYLVRGRVSGSGSFTDLGSTPIALFPYIGLAASTSYDFQWAEADAAGNVTGSWSSTGTGSTLAAGFPTIAEFPHVWIDDSSLPSGTPVSVNSIAALQSAIDTACAAGSGYITVDKTATYEGVINIPAVAAGTGEIFICSSDWGSLPARSHAYGSWVTPAADSSKMPKIVCNVGNSPALTTSGNAKRVRFIGIEFGIKSGIDPLTYAVVDLTGGSTWAERPKDFRFDRCIIRGAVSATVESAQHGIYVTGATFAMRQCYIDNVQRAGTEVHGFLILGHSGPLKFVANYCSASTISWFCGGGNVEDVQIADMEIRNNLCTKALSYQVDQVFGTKNIFEFKTGQRALVSGNVYENHWEGGQRYACTFTPRAGDTGPSAKIYDLTFHANRGKNVAHMFSLAGYDDADPVKRGKRYTISHVAADITGIGYVTGTQSNNAHAGMINLGLEDIIISHVSMVTRSAGPASYYGWEWIPINTSTDRVTRFRRINSIFHNESGVSYLDRSDTGSGPALVASNTTFSDEKNNAYCGWSGAAYSGAGHIYPADIAAMKYTNYAAQNFVLASDSPGKNAASDGTDMGCDFTKLNGS